MNLPMIDNICVNMCMCVLCIRNPFDFLMNRSDAILSLLEHAWNAQIARVKFSADHFLTCQGHSLSLDLWWVPFLWFCLIEYAHYRPFIFVLNSWVLLDAFSGLGSCGVCHFRLAISYRIDGLQDLHRCAQMKMGALYMQPFCNSGYNHLTKMIHHANAFIRNSSA